MKNPAAVSLGKLGGAAKSEAKTKAAQENGRLGGLARAAKAAAKKEASNG